MALKMPNIGTAILNPPCYPLCPSCEGAGSYICTPIFPIYYIHSSGSLDDPRLLVSFTIICFKSSLELGRRGFNNKLK